MEKLLFIFHAFSHAFSLSFTRLFFIPLCFQTEGLSGFLTRFSSRFFPHVLSRQAFSSLFLSNKKHEENRMVIPIFARVRERLI
jgi:hypothetical protein